MLTPASDAVSLRGFSPSPGEPRFSFGPLRAARTLLRETKYEEE
jgi:hypothetical protein